MCWNKEISLNTFLFSSGSILFLYYVNTYTKYKSTLYFDGSIYKYLFLLSFTMMQLLEFFLWKSIENNDKKMNYLFSIIGLGLVLIQPILSMRMTNRIYKSLIPIYLLITAGYLLLRYILNPIKFETKIGANKHLAWNWLDMKGYWQIYIFLWFFFIEYTDSNIIFPIGAAVPFFYTYYKYRKTNEWGSIWCWLINSFCLFLLIDVLIISPYKKNECK